MMELNSKSLHWEKGGGLLPAIIQDPSSQQILMLGYMNEEALTNTMETGKVTFFSRSKGRLWTKGESSGHELHVEKIETDCDRDSILVMARPLGPTCHRGTVSCFDGEASLDLSFLARLDGIIDERYRTRPQGSYTTQLFERGIDRMAQKVGEEAVETVIAAKNSDTAELVSESADLIYHLMVLLRGRELSLTDVVACLRQRHG